MTDAHFANFIAGIRKGEKLNAPIAVGNVAVTMLQLSNIAWEVSRELHLDTQRRPDPGRPGSHEDVGRASTRRAGHLASRLPGILTAKTDVSAVQWAPATGASMRCLFQ